MLQVMAAVGSLFIAGVPVDFGRIAASGLGSCSGAPLRVPPPLRLPPTALVGQRHWHLKDVETTKPMMTRVVSKADLIKVCGPGSASWDLLSCACALKTPWSRGSDRPRRTRRATSCCSPPSGCSRRCTPTSTPPSRATSWWSGVCAAAGSSGATRSPCRTPQGRGARAALTFLALCLSVSALAPPALQRGRLLPAAPGRRAGHRQLHRLRPGGHAGRAHDRRGRD